jgi:hypothetical protein
LEITLFDLLHQLARQFRLLSWRESVSYRNELIRSTALHMIDNHIADLERVKKALRHRLRYHEMGKEDQVLFRQHTAYLKKILTGWSLVGAEDQAAFRAGAIPPSTLASRIRAARKAPLA